MEKLSMKITDYITSGTALEREVIKYGVDAILSTVLCFSTALIVCALLGNFLYGCIFIIFLTPIKMQFLGYHCKTMARCITTYSICVGSSLLIFNYSIQFSDGINLAFYFIVLSVLLILTSSELTTHKTFVLFIYFLVGIAFYFIIPQLYLILILALIFEIILILLKHK